MNAKSQIVIALWLLAALSTRAQHSYLPRLRAINKQIAAAYQHQDPTALLRIYADKAVSMPEYHLTLFGKKAIAHYLRNWMDSARVDSYSRQTHDITKAGDYLVETGTFRNQFFLRAKAVDLPARAVDYEGKYLDIWQIKPDGGLQLISEITGAIKNVERSDLPLSTMQIPDTTILAKPTINATTLAIKLLDDQIATLVMQRKGKGFCKVLYG